MRKILLLGGSAQQIAAIATAQKLGYYTVLCDYLPDNPGQHYADKYYCVSTTDPKAVLEVAERERVDGIAAYATDPGALTAAYVAEKMELPGNPYSSVEILTNKDRFREFLAKHDFYTPSARGYHSLAEARKDIDRFKFPIIIKPVDSSGSKGISMLFDQAGLQEKIEYALSFSRCKRFIIEEFVKNDGYQVAGDGFSVNGKLIFRCLGNDHFDRYNINPFVPIAASFPYNMPRLVHAKIHAEIQRLLTLLDMKTGAYNFDIRIDKDENVYLMEVGPRNGGNYIPQVTKYATGVDMVEYTIKAALGQECSDLVMAETEGFWSYYAVHSPKPGFLKQIKIDEGIKQGNIVESYINYKVGDRVPAFTGANSTLGILIMRFDSISQMLYMMDNAERWINVILE